MSYCNSVSFKQKQVEKTMPEPTYILRKHQEDVTVVKFLDFNDDNSNILASGDVTGNVKLWNLETRRPIHEFKPAIKQCSIPNIEYNHINNTLVTSTRSPSHGWIHGWDMNKLLSNNHKNKAIFKFDTHCSSFCRFRIIKSLNDETSFQNKNKPNPFQSQLQSKSNENVNEHDEQKQESKSNDDEDENKEEENQNESLLSKMLKKHEKTVKQQKQLNDDNDDNETIISSNIDMSHMLIASCGFDRGLLQIWDCHNCKVMNELNFDEIPNNDQKRGMLMGIDTFHTNIRNDILVVVTSESGFVDVYNVRAGKIMFSKKFGETEPLTCMALNKKKNQGIAAGADNKMYAFSIKYNQQKIKLKKEFELKNEGVNILKIRYYDESIFGLGGWDHRTRIYSWKTFKPLCILKGHKDAVTDIDFHPKCNLLASASKDTQIAMYNLY